MGLSVASGGVGLPAQEVSRRVGWVAEVWTGGEGEGGVMGGAWEEAREEGVRLQGSEVGYTPGIRSILRAVVHKYNIHSMVDMPCGAMEWMPHVLELLNEDQPGFRYGCPLRGIPFPRGLG